MVSLVERERPTESERPTVKNLATKTCSVMDGGGDGGGGESAGE